MFGQWAWEVFARKRICMCGLGQKSVCTYTSSRIPAFETKELGDVLEVSDAHLVDAMLDGITVAIKARDGLGFRALRRITRSRRRAVGRALRLLLDSRALLGWTGHLGLCVVLALIGEACEGAVQHRLPTRADAASRRDGE
jgi:hypothetical protein